MSAKREQPTPSVVETPGPSVTPAVGPSEANAPAPSTATEPAPSQAAAADADDPGAYVAPVIEAPPEPTGKDVALFFHGDPEMRFLRGVPPRNLTQAEVDERTPAQLREMTEPSPVDGLPMYSTEKKAKPAETGEA